MLESAWRGQPLSTLISTPATHFLLLPTNGQFIAPGKATMDMPCGLAFTPLRHPLCSGVVSPSHKNLSGKRLYLYYSTPHAAWVIGRKIGVVKEPLAVLPTSNTRSPVGGERGWMIYQSASGTLAPSTGLTARQGGSLSGDT